jgi:hypothetical protein
LRAEFNGADLASILAHAESGVSSIVHTADTHTFIAGAETYLTINSSDNEVRVLGTDGTARSILSVVGNLSGNDVRFYLEADDDTNQVTIVGDAQANSITHTADHHNFNLQDFANNAAAAGGGLVSGDLYFTNTAGEGIVKIVI